MTTVTVSPKEAPDVGPACSFYIVAHADDVELFMGPNAWSNIADPIAKAVFIVLSSGDAGLGVGSDGTGKPYYLAREVGHERAIRLWLSLTGIPVPDTQTARITLAGKSLRRSTITERIVIYNLRLPDGNPRGTGYPGTGNQALSLLTAGKIAQIRSIDGDLEFTYSELRELIQEFITHEAGHNSVVTVHIQDEDPRLNPRDHADHTATAVTVVDALADAPFTSIRVLRYSTYVNRSKSRNLSEAEILIHAGTWGAYNSGLVDGGQLSNWDAGHNAWLGKQYFRSQPS